MSLTEQVVPRIRRGDAIKTIAGELNRHDSSISRAIRKAGYSAMYVTEAERKQLLAQRLTKP